MYTNTPDKRSVLDIFWINRLPEQQASRNKNISTVSLQHHRSLEMYNNLLLNITALRISLSIG